MATSHIPSSDSAPMDMAFLHEATHGNMEDLRYLVGVYIRSTRESLDKIGAAIQAQDAPAVALCAHGCAGSSASFGATRMAMMLRELEAIGRDPRLVGAAEKYNTICEEYARVIGSINTIIPTAAE